MSLKSLTNKAAAVYALYPKNGREVMRELDKIATEEKLVPEIIRLATIDPEKKMEGSVVTKNLISILFLVTSVIKGDIKPEFAKQMIAKEAVEGLRAVTPSAGILGLFGSVAESEIVIQYKKFIEEANAEVDLVLKQQASNDSKEARDLVFKCLSAESRLKRQFDGLKQEEKRSVDVVQGKLAKVLTRILQARDATAAASVVAECVSMRSVVNEVKFTPLSPKSSDSFRHVSFFTSELPALQSYLKTVSEMMELAEKQKLPSGMSLERLQDYESCIAKYDELQKNSMVVTEKERELFEQHKFSIMY